MAGPLGTNSGAVHKRTSKPHSAWSRNKQQRPFPPRGPPASQYGIGSPPLAALTAENRKRMTKRNRGKKNKSKNKRSFENATPLSAASKTPGGGLFPATPHFMIGAPTIRNDQLLNRPRSSYPSIPSSMRGPNFTYGCSVGERGILGISDVYNDEEVPEADEDLGEESIDYFGSNMGLIVLKGASPEASGSGGSPEENDSGRSDVGSDEDAPEEGDARLRGMELQLDDTQGLFKQRQQESRINHQAEYIQQLEDDNLLLRGQMIKMEEELDRLRQKDEEHINLQERMYLLEEELRQLKNSGEDAQEDPETPMAED